MKRCLVFAVLLSSTIARADDDTEPAKPPERTIGRTREASLANIFRGPFPSSRLFSMPAADTVGAYILTLSGDASLLQQPGALTSAGLLAIGFGDIAQLEYRHTSAISVTGINAPLPAVGVQLKIPIPERPNVPAFGVAFRLGVPRTETFGDTAVEETVTDFYLVGRLRFEFARWLTLHGGARISSAKIELSGDRMFEASRRLVLPAGGYELAMNPTAKIIGEIALAPQFMWDPAGAADPVIDYGLLGRFGFRWAIVPSFALDGSIGYQVDVASAAPDDGPSAIVQWDIRLGAEVFVPWGALACRAAGVFCD